MVHLKIYVNITHSFYFVHIKVAPNDTVAWVANGRQTSQHGLVVPFPLKLFPFYDASGLGSLLADDEVVEVADELSVPRQRTSYPSSSLAKGDLSTCLGVAIPAGIACTELVGGSSGGG